MSSNLALPTVQDYSTVLVAAAATCCDRTQPRPQPNVVKAALLQAEVATRRQSLVHPFSSLQGAWRLGFVVQARKQAKGGVTLGSGFYAPAFAPAQISFAARSEAANWGEIGNQVTFAGIRFRLTGPCRYLGKKNLLAFDFTRMQVDLLGQTVYQGGFRKGTAGQTAFEERAIAQLPFFAFIYASDVAIAARGRGGGLALWVRQQS
jgi:hypothetical protein